MQVSEPALAAVGEQGGIAVPGEVGDRAAGLRVVHQRTDRHAQQDVLACRAVAVGAHPAFAVAGAVGTCETEVDQRVDVAVGDRMDVAAAATVTARISGRNRRPPHASHVLPFINRASDFFKVSLSLVS